MPREKNNPGVTNLTVAVQEETVTLSGTAKDAAAFEKTVLIAGNVEGVAKVEAAAFGAAWDSSFVLIKAGDTL
ncbi:MAG: BON domain-containing protein [Cyanobacteria bacterium]|nr:BON domain-containing protein [Cyanobacteriota bacterium]